MKIRGLDRKEAMKRVAKDRGVGKRDLSGIIGGNMNIELKPENDWMTCREMDTRSYRIPAVSVLEWMRYCCPGLQKVKPGERVVDLGTGTGIIPILLEARSRGSSFTGLEIQPESADMASRSVQLNDLQERVHIVKWRY